MPFVITIDESEICEEEREFHEHWARNLNVSIEELFKLLLLAAIDGDPFVAKRPEVEPPDFAKTNGNEQRRTNRLAISRVRRHGTTKGKEVAKK